MCSHAASAEEWNNPYTDVPSYAVDWVKWVTENDIMDGTSKTTFSPNAVISRAQFANMLFRYAKPDYNEVSSSFDDVPSSSPFALALSWAKQNVIVKGIGNNLFATDITVNTEQAATIIYRYIQYIGKTDLFAYDLQFENEEAISVWAQEAYKKVCKRAAIAGVLINAPGEGGSAAQAMPKQLLSRINAVHFIFMINEIIT